MIYTKKSWWGYMNLDFYVALYCGAAEAGVVPTISFSDNSLQDDVGFQTCVELWKGFWENDHATFLASCTSMNKEENDNDNNDDNDDRPEHDVKLYPDPWTGQPWGW